MVREESPRHGLQVPYETASRASAVLQPELLPLVPALQADGFLDDHQDVHAVNPSLIVLAQPVLRSPAPAAYPVGARTVDLLVVMVDQRVDGVVSRLQLRHCSSSAVLAVPH